MGNVGGDELKERNQRIMTTGHVEGGDVAWVDLREVSHCVAGVLGWGGLHGLMVLDA